MKLLLSLVMLALSTAAASAYCLNPNQSPMQQGAYTLSETAEWFSARVGVWEGHALNGCGATTTGFVGAHPSFAFSLDEPAGPRDAVYFQLQSQCTNLIMVLRDAMGTQHGWTGRLTEGWVTGNDRLNYVNVWVGTTDGQSCDTEILLAMYHQREGT